MLPDKRPRRIEAILLSLLAVLAGLGGPAVADAGAEAERVRVRYDRQREERPATRREAPRGTLPSELVLEPAKPTRASTATTEDSDGGDGGDGGGGAVVSTRPPAGEPAPHPLPAPGIGIDGLATRAARWTAREIARTEGRREYYRLGAYDGVRTAVGERGIGSWDRGGGMRLGLTDPEAVRVGSDAGVADAEDAARETAEQRVVAQFRDLSREPRFDPVSRPPAYAPPEGWAFPVELADVFRDFPPTRRFSPRLARTFDDWRYDAWDLYDCPSYKTFFDAQWADPKRAFDFWKRDRRRAERYRALDREGRQRFERVFRGEFAHELPRFFEEQNRRGYDLGFEDGWHYGAFVREEWQFRLGYNEGFDRAVVAAALGSFRAGFPLAFERHYASAFDEWSQNAKPGIVAVTLVDGDDDGVFEPGEDLLADFEIANYGGRSGVFLATLEGGVLERPAQTTVELPARRIRRSEAPIRAAVDPRTPPRTRAELEFRVAESLERLPLVVSYPLEFAGNVALDRVDTLAGLATLVARVANRSRKPVRGIVELEQDPRFEVLAVRGPEVLAGGETGRVVLELGGLRPVDLLAGTLRAGLSARRLEVVQDRRTFRFPKLATDLGNRDLLDYMVALSRDRGAAPDDVDAVRRLLLERLRVDWRAAVSGRGNPYKQDRRDGGVRTALGDLVRTYRAEGTTSVNPAVFDGLREDVMRLAGDLPGTHPLLRKQVRKLARRLG